MFCTAINLYFRALLLAQVPRFFRTKRIFGTARIQRFVGILEAARRICLIIGGIYWLGVLRRFPLYLSLIFPSLLPLASYTVDFQLRTRGEGYFKNLSLRI